MRRLTARYRRWLEYRSDTEMEKRQRSNAQKERLSEKGSAALVTPPGDWRQIYFDGDGRLTVGTPEVLSFTDNYGETVEFLHKLRELRNKALKLDRSKRVDFRAIKVMRPAAALCVVSELDRWRKIAVRPLRLTASKLTEWDPNIRRLLDEMGFFEVLGVAVPPPPPSPGSTGSHWIRFKTGTSNDGSLHKQLRLEMQNLVGPFPHSTLLYDALVEAMANAIDHAYPDDDYFHVSPNTLGKRWWLSGSVDQGAGRIQVIFFDQGATIPVSLPRWSLYERARGVLNTLGWASDDGHMIAAAMEVRRTSTDLGHRGKGFSNITRLADSNPSNKLRIISRNGSIIYRPGMPPEIAEQNVPLAGTLISWDLSLTDFSLDN